MADLFPGSLTDVAGLTLGHAQHFSACTGVTAILCVPGTVGGVDVRGAAPGTRETDLLAPGNLVQGPHAVLLCGGSAFGLAAADGAMRWLRERGVGVDVGVGVVPIVPAAVLFDLACGRADVWPDAAMGYAACAAAGKAVAQGRVGAGAGATVGKLIPGATPAPGGVGTACLQVGPYTVGAVVAVNAAGDVYHPHTGAWLAGGTLGGAPVPAQDALCRGGAFVANFGQNTTIGLVATDAALTKAQAARLATVGHDGIARCVRPAHTQVDGDTLFAVATCQTPGEAPLVALCAAAAEVVARAIVNAVTAGAKP
ncbi:MAG: P1 family peptidase [Oscillospiraceae bacterium]|jgi:L-aminopeptidase/D-esterase-like protein|nr:P1 family peptidase [Oscillospiraceae bacterium]